MDENGGPSLIRLAHQELGGRRDLISKPDFRHLQFTPVPIFPASKILNRRQSRGTERKPDDAPPPSSADAVADDDR